jgi:mannose-6-phosphate isomerase-like protein (cupin superfamily)
MPFRTLQISELEPIPELDGNLLWHPLRHALGISAFGVNAYTAPRAGDEVVEEHTEGSGHEELYVVLAGSARFTIDGERLDAPAGTCVFLPDGETLRHAVALEDGTRVLAVGASPGKPFEVSAWEWAFRAEPHKAAGDWDGAGAIVREGLQQKPGHPRLLYELACIEARAGRADAALEHLLAALVVEPELRERAAGDSDLDSLRDRADFPL